MRYPVEMLLDLMSAGMTTEEILEDYDDLEKEDLQACLYICRQVGQRINNELLTMFEENFFAKTFDS